MQNRIEITFLRREHAQAEDEEVYEGGYDSPFINIGRGQIRPCAKGWQKAGFSFDRIFISTMVCASESAHIIAENFNTPLETDPDWMEFNHGPQAGLRHQVAADQRPHDILRAAIGYGPSINATGIWFLFSDIGFARDTILKNINGICWNFGPSNQEETL